MHEADRLVADLPQPTVHLDDVAESISRLQLIFCWTAAMPRSSLRR
jgi:hypothetical protein